jgi:hypothetical protein
MSDFQPEQQIGFAEDEWTDNKGEAWDEVFEDPNPSTGIQEPSVPQGIPQQPTPIPVEQLQQPIQQQAVSAQQPVVPAQEPAINYDQLMALSNQSSTYQSYQPPAPQQQQTPQSVNPLYGNNPDNWIKQPFAELNFESTTRTVFSRMEEYLQAGYDHATAYQASARDFEQQLERYEIEKQKEETRKLFEEQRNELNRDREMMVVETTAQRNLQIMAQSGNWGDVENLTNALSDPNGVGGLVYEMFRHTDKALKTLNDPAQHGNEYGRWFSRYVATPEGAVFVERLAKLSMVERSIPILINEARQNATVTAERMNRGAQTMATMGNVPQPSAQTDSVSAYFNRS